MIRAAILTTLATVGVHLYLTVQHFQLKMGLTTSAAACNINATFNCDVTAISQYAVFIGVPVAIWGAVANFILVVILCASAWNLSPNRDRVLRIGFILASLIAGVSIWMGVVSSFILGTYCLYCMATYVLSFMSLFFIWKGLDRGFSKEIPSDIKALFTDQRWLLITLALIPVGGFLVHAMFANNYGVSKVTLLVRDRIANWQAAAVQNFNLETGLASRKGQEPVRMTIVEFADFKCPHCRMAYPTMQAFASGRSDVRLIYKAFPLDGTCNAELTQKSDGSRCQLTFATFCGEKLAQKGWEFHNWIFDNQEKFMSGSNSETLLKELAAEKNVSYEELQKCMASSEIYDLVLAQAKEGSNAKIQGTPSVFINGKLLEAGHYLPVLEAVYKEIKK